MRHTAGDARARSLGFSVSPSAGERAKAEIADITELTSFALAELEGDIAGAAELDAAVGELMAMRKEPIVLPAARAALSPARRP